MSRETNKSKERSIDRSPAQLSSSLAIIATIIAVGANMMSTIISLSIGLIGAIFLSLGLLTSSQRDVTLGSWVLFLAAVASAWYGASLEILLVAVTFSILAADFGEHAINVGQQMGRAAEKRSAELAHCIGGSVVGIGTAICGYLIFHIADTGYPTSAVTLMLLGVILLLIGLRR